MTSENLLAGPPPTLLPEDEAAREALVNGRTAEQVAAAFPTYALAWAILAEEALAEDGRTVEGYAYARTGYHRSLDLLRRNGWKGQGPVPWSHEPNRGFLRSLAALGAASAALGDDGEALRCRTFLRESSPEAADTLGV